MRSSVQTLTVWRWNPEEKIFPASLRFVNGVGPLSAHADGLSFCLLGVSHLRNALLPSMRKKRRWLRMLCAVILLWKVSGLSSCFSSCSSWLLLGAGTRSLLFICGPQSPLGWHHLNLTKVGVCTSLRPPFLWSVRPAAGCRVWSHGGWRCPGTPSPPASAGRCRRAGPAPTSADRPPAGGATAGRR